MLYFAYGSNMNWEQMKRRCPSAAFVSIAKLKDHRFAIARTSYSRGCGSAGALPGNGARVWGVVYDVDQKDFGPLDEAEDFVPGREKNSYRRVLCTVYTDGDESKAWSVSTYFPEVEENPPLPNPEYKRLIVEGATYWRLPGEYVRELEKMIVSDHGKEPD